MKAFCFWVSVMPRKWRSAALNQAGRPMSFMTMMLHGSELHYPAMEEAMAIVDSLS